MFLVLTRSPRRVDELSFLARRIPTIKTPYIEERSEENKDKIKLYIYIYIYIYIYKLKVGPTCPPCPSRSVSAPKQLISPRFKFQ